MNYSMKSNGLEAVFESKGAELISLKSAQGIEYMWSADEKYWNRHAPVLFPIVGKVLDNEYEHEGKNYNLTQHGFARDLEFEVSNQTENSITFSLEANEETLKKYPFMFKLDIKYTFEGCTLRVGYTVTNIDKETMYFGIGAHPGFMCPLVEGETVDDYYLELEQEESCPCLEVAPVGYLSENEPQFNGKIIPLSKEFFAKGTLILKEFKSKSISLKSRKNNHKVTVGFEGFPFLAIWSLESGAPFMCIEPWFGHVDYIKNSKQLNEKRDMVSLKAQEVFSCEHSITFE